jgi:hypothetical protein
VCRRGAFVAGVVGLAPILLSLTLVPLGADYVNTQNSLGTVVPLTVALAAAFAAIRPAPAGVLAVGAVSVLWFVLIVDVARDSAYQRADWRAAFAAAVAGDPPAGGRLLVVGPDYEGWFARAPARVYLADARSVDPLERTAKPFRSLVRDAEARAAEPAPDEVVFLLLGSAVDAREVERLLGPGHRRLGLEEGEGFQVTRYDVSGSDRIWRAATEPTSLSGVPVGTLYVP